MEERKKLAIKEKNALTLEVAKLDDTTKRETAAIKSQKVLQKSYDLLEESEKRLKGHLTSVKAKVNTLKRDKSKVLVI